MQQWEHGLRIGFDVLGHESLALTTTPTGLPSLPELRLIKRFVIRALDGPIWWMVGDYDHSIAMKADEGEVVSLDTDPARFFMRSDTGIVDVRIIYLT
jgi:hypothetical protein